MSINQVRIKPKNILLVTKMYLDICIKLCSFQVYTYFNKKQVAPPFYVAQSFYVEVNPNSIGRVSNLLITL